MNKYSFFLKHRLKLSDLPKHSSLSVHRVPELKYSTINNLYGSSWKQIGHLLGSLPWNFRYLPSGACVYIQNERRYIQEGNNSTLRWLSKMAALKAACTKETELRDDFEKAFHLIMDELTQQKYENNEIKAAISWLQEVMEYNVQGGKKARGLAVVVTFSTLYGDVADSTLLDKAFVLGWCIEMLQAFFLVNDDIMDQSTTRRGKECWYRKAGLGAVNDAIMIEIAIYKILKDHFEALPCYKQIVEEFRETTWRTSLGQCLDLKSSPEGHPDWDLFTQERYETTVKYKTTWYTFCLPIHLAFILGEYDFSGYKDLDDILIKMGYYFQVQDDYLDCFGDPLVTGKYGSDIEDGKCTWLILEALKAATDDDTKKILKDNYGRNSPDSSSVVKKVYQGLNIPERYKKFESEIYQEIQDMIQRIQPIHAKCVPVLLSILGKLHQRNK